MNRLSIGILFLTVFFAACEDPAANKPKAQTTNSAASTTNTATGSTVDTAANSNVSKPDTKGTAYKIFQDNSQVEFVGSKVTGKHDGGFKSFSGTIDLVNKKPEESRVSVDIDTTSIYSDDDKLTGHLKSADFFEVEKYPKATFVSTEITPDPANGAGNYTVTGDFDLHGQKKSITFPAKITINDSDVLVESEFSINRKDFGIVYAGKTDDLIRDNVVIKLNLKAVK